LKKRASHGDVSWCGDIREGEHFIGTELEISQEKHVGRRLHASLSCCF